eukprot:8200362-Pyramimonas_sp.AAC.1
MSLSRSPSLVLPAGNLPWGVAKLARLSICLISARQGVVVFVASTASVSTPGRALPSLAGPLILGFSLCPVLAICARTLAPASTACRSPDRMAV